MTADVSFLLDFDRADSVFSLLFSFTKDEACVDLELQPFETALFDITGGVRLPEGASERLRGIYERTMARPEELREVASQIALEFSRDRQTLVALASVLLRLSMVDGMLCRRDRERLTEVVRAFDFSWTEIEFLPPEERDAIAYLTSGHLGAAARPSDLLNHYETLGCSPQSSDAELRTVYRKLVMRYHPDREAAREAVRGNTGEAPAPCATRFRQIRRAYEAIKRERRQNLASQ